MAEVRKAFRVLEIYSRLMDGHVLKKDELAKEFGVDPKSIQRDIEDIRMFIYEKELRISDNNEIKKEDIVPYVKKEEVYYLGGEGFFGNKLSNSEILAVCKILLESRAVTRQEMERVLDKLVKCCTPEKNRKMVANLIRNEAYHYVEPRHKTVFIDKMWELGKAIQNQFYIEIEYQRNKGHKLVKRRLKPAAIMFSEFYFYLAAFIEDKNIRQDFDNIDDAFPTIYRIDRIRQLHVLDEHYRVIYKDRFQEGEFRKRIQFMYGGKLQKIKFQYSGLNVESVLDRLPTAEILSEEDGVYTISAEVFGKGIDMWIRSQGEFVTLIER